MLFILSSCLFYSNYLAIVCMCLTSFILHTVVIEPAKKLIITLVLVGIHLMSNPSIHLWILMALFLFQLIITIMITSRSRVQLTQRIKAILALGIGGSIMIGFIPYLAVGVRNLISIGMYGLTSAVSVGFLSVVNKTEVDGKKQERLSKLTSSNKEVEKFKNIEYTIPPYLYILSLVFLIICIVAVFYFVKKKRNMQVELLDKRINILTDSSNLSKLELTKGRVAKMAPPTNPVRRLVFNFEKEMKGINKRKHGESFHDWLERIHIQENEWNVKMNEIYEKARYGEEEILKDEVNFFKERLRKISNQLIKNRKNNHKD